MTARSNPADGRNMSAGNDRDLEVFLDTNNKCNLKCLTCVFSNPRVTALKMNTMAPDLFGKVCEQILPRAEYATLSCVTEPLMTRNFGRYLRRAGECGVPRLEFVTNGLLLTEDHLDACLEAHLWRLSISADGADAATYEAIRRGASFDRIRQKIAMAVDRFGGSSDAPRLRIIMTLIKENFLSAAEATRQFIDWGATEIELRETVTFPDIGLEDRQLHDRKEELQKVLAEARKIAEDAGVPIEIISENAPETGLILANIPPCHALERRVAIAANGDVMPCMLWAREPLGNLTQNSFEEIWSGSRRSTFRDEFQRDQPPMWCPTCTACKDDPNDDDAYYRLLAKTTPGG